MFSPLVFNPVKFAFAEGVFIRISRRLDVGLNGLILCRAVSY